MMKKPKLTSLRAVTLGLPTVVALAVFMGRSDGRVARKQDNDLRRQIGPTVEQVDKNIKVLNGMPESQLIPAMKFIAASLGVACNYCHITKDGQLDTAADDKETKRTARVMIKMVLDANKTTFHGNPVVSCYTCHRGQTSPQGFPGLPVALRVQAPTAGGPGAAAQSSPTATVALPPAEDVLNKYISAIGGQSAIDAIKSCIIKGKVANASGSTGTYEVDQVAPDQAYELLATQRGARERVLNDRLGWEKNAFGVNALAGQQLEDLKLSLPLFVTLKLKDQFRTLETFIKEKIGDHEVYVVNAIRPDQKRERLYFDTESGLLLRRVSETETIIGVIPEQTDFDDYREVESGVKLPTTIRVSAVDALNPTSTRTFDEIKVNVPVDDSRFKKPSESPP